MSNPTRVLFVGETWLTVKFNIKGFDIFPVGGYENYGVWFMEAMSRFDDLQVQHMPNHVAMGSFPSALDQLNQYDVVVFSDCGKNTISLYPDMFTVPMGPDRLALIKEYVANGKSFVMAGGWNSYQGLNGIPGYHGTAVEEILPVEIQATDDRVETPQAVRPQILAPDHPIFRGVSGEWPLFLGYNRVKAKAQGELLATIGGDPFIVTQQFDKGKTMAFTSDLARHWGTDFVNWEGYGNFWHNTLCWLAGKS
jgi:uncharacterized membrane protein